MLHECASQSKSAPRATLRRFHAVWALALLAAPLFPPLADGEQPAPIELAPDKAVEARLALPAQMREPIYRSYRFEVPSDAIALQVELEADADLDMYLDTRPLEDWQQAAFVSSQSGGRERIVLMRDGDPPLATGSYYLDIAYVRNELPRTRDGRPLQTISYRLRVRLFRPQVSANLQPGEVLQDALGAEATGPVRTYAIDVPEGVSCLRVDLVADRSDLDMRLGYEHTMASMEQADVVSQTAAGNETILVTPPEGEPTLPAGRYFLDVVDPAWLDWTTSFRILARFDAAPPEGLLELPRFRKARNERERVLQACVELLHGEGGGSGVLISEQGYVLTNHHVVEGATPSGTARDRPIMIAFNTDPHEPPKVRCLGKVIAYDRALDLALVRIVSDLYGRPLPEGYRFPAAALGDPERLSLGDPLYAFGYPDIGGLGTRVPITCTRGVVSGFERRGDTVHIKTDAEINSGNSGGPVCDARFRVIGLATEVIPAQGGNGQLAYVRPLWLVPAAWWRQAGVER